MQNSLEWISTVEKIINVLNNMMSYKPPQFWSTLVYSSYTLKFLDSIMDFYIRFFFEIF